MSSKLSAKIYFIGGILFFISSILYKNYVLIPLGCLFIILGAKYNKQKEENDSNKELRTRRN